MVNRKPDVVIIDTGCANISSVKFAIERLNYSLTVSQDPERILNADKVFLPGVGTAAEAMKNLQERDLIALIRDIEQPVLGICLGMQLLGSLSEEYTLLGNETTPCLNLIDMPIQPLQSHSLPLPHMGWNRVEIQDNHPLFRNIAQHSHFYFVHSYAAPLSAPKGYTIAQSDYGQTFSAAVARDNYFGVQFHPERSSQAGSQLIQNFLTL